MWIATPATMGFDFARACYPGRPPRNRFASSFHGLAAVQESCPHGAAMRVARILREEKFRIVRTRPHRIELAIERCNGILFRNHDEFVVLTFEARFELVREACLEKRPFTEDPLRRIEPSADAFSLISTFRVRDSFTNGCSLSSASRSTSRGAKYPDVRAAIRRVVQGTDDDAVIKRLIGEIDACALP